MAVPPPPPRLPRVSMSYQGSVNMELIQKHVSIGLFSPTPQPFFLIRVGLCSEASLKTLYNIYRWAVSPWNPCSKTCGPGLQYRSVRCIHQAPDGTIGVSPSRLCTSDKPSGVQNCIRKACHLRWLADPWSQVSG